MYECATIKPAILHLCTDVLTYVLPSAAAWNKLVRKCYVRWRKRERQNKNFVFCVRSTVSRLEAFYQAPLFATVWWQLTPSGANSKAGASYYSGRWLRINCGRWRHASDGCGAQPSTRVRQPPMTKMFTDFEGDRVCISVRHLICLSRFFSSDPFLITAGVLSAKTTLWLWGTP